MIVSRNRYGSTLHPRCVGRSHRCLGAESMQRMLLLLLRKIVLYTLRVHTQYTLHSTQVKLAHSCSPVVHGTHYPQPDAHKTEVLSTTVVNRWYIRCIGAGQSKGGDGTLGGDNEEAGFNIIPPSSNQPTNPTTPAANALPSFSISSTFGLQSGQSKNLSAVV